MVISSIILLQLIFKDYIIDLELEAIKSIQQNLGTQLGITSSPNAFYLFIS